MLAVISFVFGAVVAAFMGYEVCQGYRTFGWKDWTISALVLVGSVATMANAAF